MKRILPLLAALLLVPSLALAAEQTWTSTGTRSVKGVCSAGACDIPSDATKGMQLTSVTRVAFREIDGDEIERYCATSEPYDKAGGYAIQGLAAVFVERIEGSYSGVMGLPLFETAMLLKQAGVTVL